MNGDFESTSGLHDSSFAGSAGAWRVVRLTLGMNFTRVAVTFAVVAPLAFADFSYDSTSKITGGTLLGMMKMAGAFSKDARKSLDALPSTITVKGNRLIHKTADVASIIDLDQETITTVNYAASTYSVMTFAQMKQAMDDMAKKMQQRGGGADPDAMQFDFKVNDTGQQKEIAGENAHQVIVTMAIQGQDAKSGQKGGLDLTTDMWLASGVAGYGEIREFYKRMAPKLAWTPGGVPMMNRPDMQKAMSQLYAQGSKLDGMPVQQTIKMGGVMDGMPAGQGQSSAATPTPSMADLLGGRFGGLGRKKKDPQSDGSAAANGDASSASLLEMSVAITRYSTALVDTKLFEVPANFQQVQADSLGQKRR